MPRSNYARIAVLLVFVVVLYYIFRILEPFLPALVWATILATVFRPLFSALSRWLRHPRWAGALSCLVLTLVIVLPAMFLVFVLAQQSVSAYRLLEGHVMGSGPASFAAVRRTTSYQWFLSRARGLGMPEPDLAAMATKALGVVSSFLVSRSASLFSGVTRLVINFVVIISALYYLLLKGPEILLQLRQLSFLRPEYEEKIAQKFLLTAQATFGGGLATALIYGAAGGLVFLIFRVPSPLLWGAVMGLLSLVPVVGAAVVWAPLGVYYLLTGAVWKGVILLAVFAAIAGVVENVVKPIFIKRGTQMDSLWVFLSVLGGIGVFGFLGLFLGPFLFTLLSVLVEIYKVEFRDELRGNVAS
jgi:predicted PurR-regulated permease PerM